jgi:hypothetical protein
MSFITIPRVCPLTHLPYSAGYGDCFVDHLPANPLLIQYRFAPIGEAHISLPTWLELTNGVLVGIGKPYFALAGLCREAAERGQVPPNLTADLLRQPPTDLPYTFEERADRLLQVLYEAGGREQKPRDIEIHRDFPLAYAQGHAEFQRLLERLVSDGLLSFDKPNDQPNEWVDGIRTNYFGVLPTPLGRRRIEQRGQQTVLPELVRQVPPTFDVQVSVKIQHAKALFFKEEATLEEMRSACVTLCNVLEPLRMDAKQVPFPQFSKDVEAFFGLVNQFEIRHNKEQTKRIEFPEQFEYVFYGLLNLINTHYKFQQRANKK